MHILLLIFYGALAGYGIWKIPFLRKSGIRPAWLWIIYALHVLTGWAHNWIAWRYFPDHGDIWNYFQLSFLYRHRLLSEFHLFLSDNSTWTYITHNGIVYVQMLLNFLSGDDMTINTLLFAFPVFVGNIALYRVFRGRFGGDGMAAGSVLWLPSVVFWTSCIYREGMLYLLLGFLFYHLDVFFSTRARRSFYFALVLFLLIAYFRLAVGVILIPALLVWWWMEHPGSRRLRRRLVAVVIILLVAAFAIPVVRGTLLGAVTTEQASFQLLEGHSRLSLPVLDGSLPGFWRALPYAIRNGFFEPLPGAGGQPMYLFFSVELAFVWLLVVLALFRTLRPAPTRPTVTGPNSGPTVAAPPSQPTVPDQTSRISLPAPPSQPKVPQNSPQLNYGEFAPIRNKPSFSAACVLFALAGMLLIGFVVPFAGTIVRYRSIYLPFLLGPALHTLSRQPALQRLNRWLNNKLRFLI